MRFLVVLGLLAGLTGTVAAGPSADALFDDGKRLLAKKSYARACAAFKESFAIDPAIGTQLNIGLCYEKWGKWPDAYRAYTEAARLAREANDARFSKIRVQLERAGRRVARVAIRLPGGADARVQLELDGKPLDPASIDGDVAMEPGKHRLVVRVPGRAARIEQLEIGEGEREVLELGPPRRVAVAPKSAEEPARNSADERESGAAAGSVARSAPEADAEPQPSPPIADDAPASGRKRARLVAGIGLAVLGAAAIGTGGYIALDARTDYKAAAAMCPGGMCTSPEAHAITTDARERARQMTYVVAAGVALGALGTYLIFTSKRTTDTQVTGSIVMTNREALVVLGGPL